MGFGKDEWNNTNTLPNPFATPQKIIKPTNDVSKSKQNRLNSTGKNKEAHTNKKSKSKHNNHNNSSQ